MAGREGDSFEYSSHNFVFCLLISLAGMSDSDNASGTPRTDNSPIAVYRAELSRINGELKALNAMRIDAISDSTKNKEQLEALNELFAKLETKLEDEKKETNFTLEQHLVTRTPDKAATTVGDARRVLGAIALAFAKNRPGGPWYEHEEVITRWRNGKPEEVRAPVPPDQVIFGNILDARQNLKDEEALSALDKRLTEEQWAALTDLHNRCNLEAHLHTLRRGGQQVPCCPRSIFLWERCFYQGCSAERWRCFGGGRGQRNGREQDFTASGMKERYLF